MNTLLIIGLVVCGAGALLWIVSTAMIAHYDQKLEAKTEKYERMTNGGTQSKTRNRFTGQSVF